jgi:hypothetical protein
MICIRLPTKINLAVIKVMTMGLAELYRLMEACKTRVIRFTN